MRKTIAIVLIFATMILMTGPAAFASEDIAAVAAAGTDSASQLDAAAGAATEGQVAGQSNYDLPPAGQTSTVPEVADANSQGIEIPEPAGAAIAADTSTLEFEDNGQLTNGTSSEETGVNASSTVEFNNATTTDATTTDEGLIGESGAITAIDTDATTADEVATTTVGVATTTIESASSSLDVATTTFDSATTTSGTEIASTTAAAASVAQLSVLAVWQMAGDGIDDDPVPLAQFEPSGEYQVSKKIRTCGVVGGSALDFAGDTGVYSQIFYPKDAAFGPNDAGGRLGCGQVTGSACKMERLLGEASYDLFCAKIQNNNANLPLFAAGSNYPDLCSDAGRILNQTASVYCCDQELAYDDISGDYEAAVMAKTGTDSYSNMLSSKFAYLSLPKLNIDFNNVYYGEVKEGVEVVANETVTNATVRNVGNVPARISLWQDDMGLGKTDGADNIRYGARLSNIDASWTYYGPFAAIVMPDVLSPGQSVDMDFSVKVLNFPLPVEASSQEGAINENKTDYQGKMKIDAAPAPADYQCQSPQLNEAQPILAVAFVPVLDQKGVDAKPETDLPKAATTTVPI